MAGYYHICPSISLSGLSGHAGILWGQKSDDFGYFCSVFYLNSSDQVELSGNSSTIYSTSADNLFTVQSPSGVAVIIKADDCISDPSRPEMTLFGDLSVTGCIYGLGGTYVTGGTFNNSTDCITLTRNDNCTVDINITGYNYNSLINKPNHDDLTGFVANEHIDHTSVSFNGIRGIEGGGDISSSRTFCLSGQALCLHDATFSNSSLLAKNSIGTFTSVATGSVANGSNNIPTSNEVFSFVASTSALGNVNIDHSAVCINTTNGIQGGGDITSSRTLGLSGNALCIHCLSLDNSSLIAKDSGGTWVSLASTAFVDSTGDTITGDLTIQGNLTVQGTTVTLNTEVCTTSAMEITNQGTGPALVVNQCGSQPIVNFVDYDGVCDNSVFYIEDGGNVGLGTTNPNERLSVVGNISASGIICALNGCSTEWNEAYNNYICAINITGSTTKTITLTQNDGGTLSANFTDNNNIYTCWSLSASDTSGTYDVCSGCTVSFRGGNGIDICRSDNVISVINTITNNSQLSNGCNYIKLTSLSTGPEGTPSGDGSLSYSDTTGVFTYTPPLISNETIAISAGTDLSTGGSFTLNQSSGSTVTINHSNITRTDDTSTASPAHGGIFTVIDSVSSNATGHITGVNTKTITLPAASTPNNATITLSAGDGLTAGGDFTTDQSSNETITFNVGVGTGLEVGPNQIFICETCINEWSTNNYLSAASFNTGNGELTLGRHNLSNITVDLDGRYSTSDNDTTYCLLVQDLTSSNTTAKITLSSSGIDSDITIVGSTNITVEKTNDSTLTIIGPDLSGYQSSLTFGIDDNNALEVDDADAADDDYAKFTANGLEGRSYAEVRTDLGLGTIYNCAATDFDKYSGWVVSDGTDSETIGSGDTLLFEASQNTSVVYCPTTNKVIITGPDLSGYQSSLTFGIADTNALKVDHASAADNDYAKFTANGLEGMSYAEVRSDLGLGTIYNCAATDFDKYTAWRLYTDTTDRGDITSGEQVRFCGGTDLSLGYTATNNVITFNHDAVASTSSHSGCSVGYGGSFTVVCALSATSQGHTCCIGTMTITLPSADDTNTTYNISSVTTTGGANLRLSGSDGSTDDVKLASGTGITVASTDANTITISHPSHTAITCNCSNGIVLQDITVNNCGHVTSVGTCNLDDRYLLNTTDTLSGTLTVTGNVSAAQLYDGGNRVWHSGNDGSGSGLDADTVDGFEAANLQKIYTGTATFQNAYVNAFKVTGGSALSSMIRVRVSGTSNGVVVTSVLDIVVNHSYDIYIASQSGNYTELTVKVTSDGNQNYDVAFKHNGSTTTNVYFQVLPYNGETITFTSTATYSTTYLEHVAKVGSFSTSSSGGATNKHTVNGDTVWHAGNDGSGSGLDADLLDGQHGSYYSNYNCLSNKPTIPTVYDSTISIVAGTDLATGGTFTLNQNGASSITINHDVIGRTNTTSAAAPAHSGTFTVVDSITTSSTGHITGVNTKTITLPADNDTCYTHPTHTAITCNCSNGIVLQDITVNNCGHVTAVGSCNLDDRYYTESEADSRYHIICSHSATNCACGWYTIATNTGDRAVARFGLKDTASGDHQSVVFYATHHFGTNSSNHIQVLTNSYYNSSKPFACLRIKEGGTYDGAALQVYLNGNTNTMTAYILGDNFQTSGWVIKDWVPDATDPGDVDNYSSFVAGADINLDFAGQGQISTTGSMYSKGYMYAPRLYDSDNVSCYIDPASTSLVNTLCGGALYSGGNPVCTSETSHADVLVDGDFTSQGIMLRGATAGSYSILTNNSSNWNTSYNDAITAIEVTGNTTKTITLTSRDGTTLSDTFTDNDTVYTHPTHTAITCNCSNGIVLQDITVNNCGHVTSVGTCNLDDRYYTETEVDSLLGSHTHSQYLLNTTDTLSGTLEVFNSGDSSCVSLIPSGGSPYVLLNRTGSNSWRIKATGNGSAQILDTSLNDTSIFTIEAGGNVGIGTTDPNAKLDVISSNNVNILKLDVGSYATYKFTANSTSKYTTLFNMDNTGLDIGHDSTIRSLNLRTGNTDRLTILGNGNVGIGITNPSQKLHVNGTICSTCNIYGVCLYDNGNRVCTAAYPTVPTNYITNDADDTMNGTLTVTGNVSAAQVYDSGNRVCTSAYPTVYDSTITINPGTDLSTGGSFTLNQSSGSTVTINHSNITRTNNTSTDSPAHEDTFTVIDSISSNATGHITGVNTKTITLPADNDTTYSLLVQDLTSSNTTAKITLRDSNEADSDITIVGSTNITVEKTNDSTLTIIGPDLSGYTGNTGTVTSVAVSAGTGLDVTGTPITTSGTIDVSLDLSELSDMTQTWDNNNDEFIVLDGGVQKRKLSSEIFGSNAFNSTTIPTNFITDNADDTMNGTLTVTGNVSAAQLYDNGNRVCTAAYPTYSTATSAVLGLVKIGYTVNNKNYPVELSSEQMFVNVPWTDTNNYVDGISFCTSDGVLKLTRNGVLSDLTVNLDGRYCTSTPNVYDATITISTGTGLEGGADFTTNQSVAETITLCLASVCQTAIANGATAFSWGDHSTVGYSTTTVNNCTITFNYGACIQGCQNPDYFDLNQSSPESFGFEHSTGGAGAGSYSAGCGCAVTGITLDAYGHVNNITIGCSTSDYRAKTCIQSYDIGYDAVKTVEAYKYVLIDDEEQTLQAGMMAHELQEAGVFHGTYGIKDEMNEDGTPKYQFVDYSQLVPTLWSALNKAINKIEDLENRLATLELQSNI